MMIMISMVLLGFGYAGVKAYFKDNKGPLITFISDQLMIKNGDYDEFFQIQDDSAYTYEILTDLETIEDGSQSVCIYAIDDLENETTICQDMEVIHVNQTLAYDYATISLDELVQDIKERYYIQDEDFTIFYENMVTKETYTENMDTLRIAASTIKLPVNMMYYDEVADGTMKLNTSLTYHSYNYEEGAGFTASDYRAGDSIPLSYLLHQSIVYSDNTAVNILIDQLGYEQFRTALSAYTNVVSDEFYNSNLINGDILFTLLQRLYDNPDRYVDLLADMKEAMPNQYMKSYLDVEIAHKYGLYGQYTHDVGIVYAQEPFLLGILSSNVSNAEDMIGYTTLALYEYQTFH